jgi:hypothetical protein
MTKLKLIVATGVSTAIVAGSLWVGVASAASTASSDVGTSGIPRSVFKAEQLDAEATVLKTTTQAVQTAQKDKMVSQLASAAGITSTSDYRGDVKATLTSELEAKGYSQDQITIALQHRTIRHLRHHQVK